MDEEQSNKKIDINSFFDRTDEVEEVANKALKQSSLSMNAVKANQTLINSISVSIEAMKTEIRDIANYIVIEKKFEKDAAEDRRFEAEDKEQKEKMDERLKALLPEKKSIAKNEEAAPPPEEKKTGGLPAFLAGLVKFVGGLALGAGLIALAPLILKGLAIGAAAGLTTLILAKILPPLYKWAKNFLSPVFKFLSNQIRRLEGLPIVGGIAGKIANALDSGAKSTSEKIAKSLESNLKGYGGGTEGGGGGGGNGEKVEVDTSTTTDSNMKIENNEVKDSSEKIKNKVKEGDSDKPKLYADYIEEGAEIKEIDQGGFAITYPDGSEQILRTLGMGGEGNTIEEKFNSTITNLEAFQKKQAELKAINDKKFESDFFKKSLNQSNVNVQNIKSSGRLNLNEQVVTNFDPSQVSQAEIRGSSTTVAYVRASNNRYLSTNIKTLPPEILRGFG